MAVRYRYILVDEFQDTNPAQSELVALLAEGKTLSSASRDGTIKLWDISKQTEIHCLRGHEKAVLAQAVSPDGKKIASASEDGTVKIWDVSSVAAPAK